MNDNNAKYIKQIAFPSPPFQSLSKVTGSLSLSVTGTEK